MQTNNKLKAYIPYLISVAIFIIYKVIYPQPIISLDSKNYIFWALADLPIAYRPIGYSKFLKFFEGGAHNHVLIIWLQYFIFLLSSLFFNDSIFREFNFNRTFRTITYFFTIYNPLALFLANMLTPDSLFLSFTLIWITTLLMVINGKDKFFLFTGVHLISFFILYQLRYNVVYYPFITIAVLLIAKRGLKQYILVCSSLILMYSLYQHTIKQSLQYTHTATFSAFGGWVMANNAIHLYDIADVNRNMWKDPDLLRLHDLVVKYKDSVTDYKRGREATALYLWDDKGPLKRYVTEKVLQGYYPNYFIGWYGVSNTYAKFATKVILAYPFAFLRQYYLPNLISFFYPKAEELEDYDLYNTELSAETMQYLGVTNNYVLHDNTGIQHYIIVILRWLYIPVDIIVLITLILILRSMIQKKKIPNSIKILALFYFLILLLSVLGHPILVRYLLPLYVTGSVLPLMYLAWQQQQNNTNADIAESIKPKKYT